MKHGVFQNDGFDFRVESFRRAIFEEQTEIGDGDIRPTIRLGKHQTIIIVGGGIRVDIHGEGDKGIFPRVVRIRCRRIGERVDQIPGGAIGGPEQFPLLGNRRRGGETEHHIIIFNDDGGGDLDLQPFARHGL